MGVDSLETFKMSENESIPIGSESVEAEEVREETP